MAAKSHLDHFPRRSMFADAPRAAVGESDVDVPRSRGRTAASRSKGGRPAKHPDKPWEREGISRMTWYRWQKAASS